MAGVRAISGVVFHVQTRQRILLCMQDIAIVCSGCRLFKDDIAALFEGNLKIVGACLLVTAALLSFAYFYRGKPQASGLPAKTPRDISWRDAFVIGCAQAVAVLPGLSRSGSTIATGILLGDKKEAVARFSFFMVIIPILGEGLLDIKKMFEPSTAMASAGGSEVSLLALIVGFVASFVVGCLACRWMLEIVKKGKLVWFAVYCVAVGLLCLCW